MVTLRNKFYTLNPNQTHIHTLKTIVDRVGRYRASKYFAKPGEDHFIIIEVLSKPVVSTARGAKFYKLFPLKKRSYFLKGMVFAQERYLKRTR